jgi:hypothetical protein
VRWINGTALFDSDHMRLDDSAHACDPGGCFKAGPQLQRTASPVVKNNVFATNEGEE